MRKLTLNLLLVALLFRAYVPAGFMPGNGTPFLLELCPATFQTHMAAHHSHHHSTAHAFEQCPFGSTPAAGPTAQVIAFTAPARIVSRCCAEFEPLRLSELLDSAHRARGPPASLI